MGLNELALVEMIDPNMHQLIEVTDFDTYEAVRYAERHVHQNWVAAIVHGFEGLYVVDDQGEGLHFRSPLCGYQGSGPIATAKILSLFHFGDIHDIYPKINDGGSDAWVFFDYRDGTLHVTSGT